jgi:hypothetical protein
MLSLALTLFWGFLAGLLLASGILFRRRVRERIGRPGLAVGDDDVRAILERGVLTFDEDEPLDFMEIDEEERRFWTEKWDEPEEW